jgi:iron-sulfur cluster assembly protein
MFKLTAEAAKQIHQAAVQSGAEDVALRIAARRDANGSIQYGMGFDAERANDLQLILEGVTVLISHYSQDLLNGAVLDFVELNPGEFNFIFINPNDSEAAPSAGGCSTGGCGSCGSGGCH